MEQQRKPTRWGLWLVVGLVTLVLYVFSVPPVYILFEKGLLPRWLSWLWYPLVWLYNDAPEPIHGALQVWWRFWLKLLM